MEKCTNTIEGTKVSWTPKEGSHAVLKDVSVLFEPGYMYGIIGPNGSGKSSFLRHVMGFLEVQQGCITVDEKEVKAYTRKEFSKKIAFVPQETRIKTDFKARDIVMTGRNPYQSRFGGVSKKDIEMVEQALAFTRCEQVKEQAFASLSGGEAQRVVIARAIAQETEWMLLDEPVSSLDIRNQVELLERLERLNQEKKTSIIMVIHDINLAAQYCNRIVMLKEGQVLDCGDTKDVMTCEKLEALYEIEFMKIEKAGKCFFFPMMKGSHYV